MFPWDTCNLFLVSCKSAALHQNGHKQMLYRNTPAYFGMLMSLACNLLVCAFSYIHSLAHLLGTPTEWVLFQGNNFLILLKLSER